MELDFGIQKLINFLDYVLSQKSNFNIHSASYAQAPMDEIRQYRDNQYLLREQHYLFNELQTKCEEQFQLDQRSHHFWVTKDGALVGCIRATPAPFELEMALAGTPLSFSPFSDYIELSRLITSHNHEVSAFSIRLLACVALFSLKNQYSGFLAMCKAPQRRLFQRFGMKPLSNEYLTLPERNHGKYWFMAGNWNEIAMGPGCSIPEGYLIPELTTPPHPLATDLSFLDFKHNPQGNIHAQF